MTKQELKDNLVRRITWLSEKPINEDLTSWENGYDNGYKNACLQILRMIKNYK